MFLYLLFAVAVLYFYLSFLCFLFFFLLSLLFQYFLPFSSYLYFPRVQNDVLFFLFFLFSYIFLFLLAFLSFIRQPSSILSLHASTHPLLSHSHLSHVLHNSILFLMDLFLFSLIHCLINPSSLSLLSVSSLSQPPHHFSLLSSPFLFSSLLFSHFTSIMNVIALLLPPSPLFPQTGSIHLFFL